MEKNQGPKLCKEAKLSQYKTYCTVTDILSFQVRPIALLKELVYIVLLRGTTSLLRFIEPEPKIYQILWSWIRLWILWLVAMN